MGRLLLALTALSALYHLAALLAAARFFRSAGRGTAEGPRPPVSLIVPLCGAEEGLAARIRALLVQDYPDYEVIFAALDPEDAGLGVARRTAAAYPGARWRAVSGGPSFGPNAKAANLDQAAALAQHEIIAHIDSDMTAAPDFLARLVSPFEDPAVGATFALYRGDRPRSAGAALEALAISCDFLPQVLVALALAEPDFGLGASIALRRPLLDRLGGYRAFASYINEDYHLVHRARRDLGARAAASSAVLAADAGRLGVRASIIHRLRWARTVRAARPAGVAGSILTNTTALAALALAAGAGRAPLVAFLALAVRISAAAGVALLAGDRWSALFAPLVLANDLLGAAVFLAAHAGRSVVWRGRRYEIEIGGRIRAEGPPARSARADVTPDLPAKSPSSA
jgi:ceramide glucosyltransferase